MSDTPQSYFEKQIRWQRSNKAEYPFVSNIDGQSAMIRLNDFPNESLYTLIINGNEIIDFDDFPPKWEKPKTQ